VVVAEFRDLIYPGLVSTGKVERGGDKPWHTVINGENYLALRALTYTHRGKIDAIYIDPPYNTGAKDWKYNNDYVETDDAYRHSKWLAMMERRLKLARELLNPDNSVLIVTIDEKEYLRLGLLLEQTFPEANIQMVSTVINPKGTSRENEFSRTNEFVFFVRLGAAKVHKIDASPTDGEIPIEWQTFRRRDLESARGTSKGGPSQFYPIYVCRETGRIQEVGEPLPHNVPRDQAPKLEACDPVFPVRPDGTEMNWATTAPSFRQRLAKGYARAGKYTGEPQPYIIQYLKRGPIRDIEDGTATIKGFRDDGSIIAVYERGTQKVPTTQWDLSSHYAEHQGTNLLKRLIPEQRFPFPKSLYAVEDALRFFSKDKPNATILDFFAGSGTTAHAVMRLNRQDGGRRQCILVTNNEVGADEQKRLREQGLRPGDPDWEQWGICEHITKPRVQAAITGLTPDGEPIQGEYKFTDAFPMAEGFAENAEFSR
jgi:adenine-specific DNA-methyltransferase